VSERELLQVRDAAYWVVEEVYGRLSPGEGPDEQIRSLGLVEPMEWRCQQLTDAELALIAAGIWRPPPSPF
jgi:hypothetical protein